MSFFSLSSLNLETCHLPLMVVNAAGASAVLLRSDALRREMASNFVVLAYSLSVSWCTMCGHSHELLLLCLPFFICSLIVSFSLVTFLLIFCPLVCDLLVFVDGMENWLSCLLTLVVAFVAVCVWVACCACKLL